MKFKDYYAILGVEPKATIEEVKKAYRALARKYHPDLNPEAPDAEDNFGEVTEAYDVLSDQNARKKYDLLFDKDKKTSATTSATKKRGPENSATSRFRHQKDVEFEDLFNEMFGPKGTFNHYKKGNRFARARTKGTEPSFTKVTVTLSLGSIFNDQKKVVTAGGRKLRITIPAGIEDGTLLKLKADEATSKNDVAVLIRVPDEAGWRREGADLHKTLPLNIYDSIFGGKVKLETLEKPVQLQIRPMTQSDTLIRVQGAGLPFYKKKGRGDLYFKTQLILPNQIGEVELTHLENAKKAHFAKK